MQFKRIVIQTDEDIMVYEGENAEAFAAWLNGAIQIASIHGMLGEKPMPTKVIPAPDDIEQIGTWIHKTASKTKT